MKFKDLAARLSRREGLKHQVHHGDVLELLRLLSIMMVTDPRVIGCLVVNGARHLLREQKKRHA